MRSSLQVGEICHHWDTGNWRHWK